MEERQGGYAAPKKKSDSGGEDRLSQKKLLSGKITTGF